MVVGCKRPGLPESGRVSPALGDAVDPELEAYWLGEVLSSCLMGPRPTVAGCWMTTWDLWLHESRVPLIGCLPAADKER